MKILCLGDSFTEGYLVDKNYTDYLKDKGHEIINLGINGDRTSGMLERFKPITCDIQITFGGTNDTFDRVSPDKIFANIKQILDRSLADKNIVIIPPLMEADESYSRYKEINQTINDYGALAKSLDITVIDARKIKPSYIDGLHMREDFHKDLANEILKVL
ncbi:GDSL-type esterase/lipase family protein [Anaerococcus cruorum]|uniref:GDSL-type esterase/lipase family protein n=1 Tax=Anaerococcus sp. WGS1596 TaxID=3366806 RepID=UPI00372D2600